MTRPRCALPPTGKAAEAAARSTTAVPRLVTDRLVLRAPDLTDLPLWTTICTGPEGAMVGGPMTEQEAWESFCVYTAGWLLHGHGLWALDRREDAELLGFVMLGLEWDDQEPELGWMLAPGARGQGYASEAAKAARDHGLKLLGPGACVSYVDPLNTASSRLAKRIGGARDAAAEAAFFGSVEIWRHGERV
ncbi:MAG: GNAT family N-acetyltransferase [Pseudomonadota bacterium]